MTTQIHRIADLAMKVRLCATDQEGQALIERALAATPQTEGEQVPKWENYGKGEGLVGSAERLHLAISVFLKDWRDGDFELSNLAQIHAKAIEEKYLEVGRALRAGEEGFQRLQEMLLRHAPAPTVAQGETPRTDAVRWFQESTVPNGVTEAVPAAHARQLERELNEAKAEASRLATLNELNADASQIFGEAVKDLQDQVATFRQSVAQHQEWGAKAREAIVELVGYVDRFTQQGVRDRAHALLATDPASSTRPKDGPGDTEKDCGYCGGSGILAEPNKWGEPCNERQCDHCQGTGKAAMQSQEKAPDSKQGHRP